MTFEEPAGARAGEGAPESTWQGWQFSRRQFVVLAGGGVAAVAVVAGAHDVPTPQGTPGNSPWTVRVVRAGRGARLRADGSPAFHLTPGPSVFTVEAGPAADGRSAGSSRGHAVGHPAGQAVSHTSGHTGGGSSPATSYPQPFNLTWGDVVVLEVEVLNTASAPLLFSPGQLRLRLADGRTVTAEDASRSPEAIAAGTAETLWVSYLAPSDAVEFSVDFADPQSNVRRALGVPRLVTARGQS